MQRIADKGGQAHGIAGGIVLGEALGATGAHRVVDKIHQRHRLHRREVDRHLVRRHQVADDQNVDVGEEDEEAFDDEDRQGDRDPRHRLVFAGAARHDARDFAPKAEELPDRRQIGRADHRSHRRHRVSGSSEPDGGGHEDDDKQRTDDIGRPQGEVRPVERTRERLLYLADREHRQRDRSKIERDQVVARNGIAEEVEPGQTDNREESRDQKYLRSTARDDAAQQAGLLMLRVFRNEAHHGELHAEAREPAQDNRADPHRDEDAVFEIAHPARQNHLTGVGNHRAGNPGHEGEECDAAGHGPVVGAV